MKNLIVGLLVAWFSGRVPKLVMLSVVVIFAVPAFVSAATFTVQPSNSDQHDRSPGDGQCADFRGVCTLRAAIEESNAVPPGLPPAQIQLPSGTYVLTLGLIEIKDSLFITGGGADSTIIDGNNSSSIFLISNPGTNPIVNISGVTIRNGSGGNTGFGTGIFISEGTSLFLANSVISENESDVGGVGIRNDGSLTLFRSTVRDNKILGGGGGVTGVGGGILNQGRLEIIESTISGNQGIRGGGIANLGSLDITNSTISGNKASAGGGIFNSSGVVNVSFSTITNNEAGLVSGEPEQNRVGGGVRNFAQVNIGNTILAGNRDGRISSDPLFSPDCFSREVFRFTSFRGNLVGIINQNCNIRDTIFGEAIADLVGTADNPLDPRLGPLSKNGGPTQTHTLQSGSPAIDQGTGVTSATFFDCPETDQRGFIRPVDGNIPRDGKADCDIGAFEFGVISQPPTQVSASGTVNDRGTPKTITASMNFGRVSGGASGTISVNPPQPQAFIIPVVVGKVLIWLLKTEKPANAVSLRDAAGGDLGGTIRMTATGTNITASFRTARKSPDDIEATVQIDAQYEPTITLTGIWSSIETIVANGVGQASGTGQSLFHTTDGKELLLPYSVSYQFLGAPNAELIHPIQASQSVNLDLVTGDFIAQTTAEEALAIEVPIDIKPGEFPNLINISNDPNRTGMITVAILTTPTFDATTVDPITVRFGKTGIEAAPVQVALQDADGDGTLDLVLHFRTQDTSLQCGDTSASLTGKTVSGQAIMGSDAIVTIRGAPFVISGETFCRIASAPCFSGGITMYFVGTINGKEGGSNEYSSIFRFPIRIIGYSRGIGAKANPCTCAGPERADFCGCFRRR